MPEQNWFYTRGEQRFGPVTTGALEQLAESGELRPDDLVWTEGQAQWMPASSRGGLFESRTSSDATVTEATAVPPSVPGAAIGYYTAISGLPARAQVTLAKHAKPIGDVGDWPLNELHVEQFRETIKQRKKVISAAQLYKALGALIAIAAAVVLAVGVVSFAGGGGRARSQAMSMLAPGGLFVGFAALYFFAWRASLRSHRWAPLTMFIVFIATILLNAVLAVIAIGGSVRSADAFAAGAGAFVGMLFPAAFAVVSWKAFAAIPKYLAQPAWCQELVAAGKL